jgi:hypothetical protein
MISRTRNTMCSGSSVIGCVAQAVSMPMNSEAKLPEPATSRISAAAKRALQGFRASRRAAIKASTAPRAAATAM